MFVILVEHILNDTKRTTTLDVLWLVNKPRLLHVISGSAHAHAVTVLNNELFVVRSSPSSSSQVNVYSTDKFTFNRNIAITDSQFLAAITAFNNCLYVSDIVLNVVYRYNLSTNETIKWSVGGSCFGLSLTSTNTILAAILSMKQIREYTPDGGLIRAISLDRSIERPEYCLQLSSDRLVVSHASIDTQQHRVCIVDMSGSIIQCYGGFAGTNAGQLYDPRHMAEDRHGSILVADQSNNRIVILSPLLTLLGEIAVPGEHLSFPRALHLDELNRRLYIGEQTYDGRVVVLSV